MKIPVVILHYHGVGHINPCLPIARILEKANYKVYFAGVEYFNKYVTSQGFSYHVLHSVPFGLGFEKWVNTIEKKKNIYWSNLRDRINDRLYKRREYSLRKMVDELQPQIILIDAIQATDFIALYSYLKSKRIRVGIIHPMFPSHVVPGRPPGNSLAFPENKKDVQGAIRTMRWQQLKKSWKQKAKYFLHDDQHIINRRMTENQVPLHFRSSIPCFFNFSLQGVHELIPAPREFDFPDFQPAPHHHYTGFMLSNHQSHFRDELFDSAWPDILKRKKSENLKVIYCSFGTTDSDVGALPKLLTKLISVTEKLNHLLIISNKTACENKGSLRLADHVYIFKSVPQPEVLTFTDLFITHGGPSSIKESIDAEVPMLMYPVHTEYDVRGNSARVAYHGMGLIGDKSDTEREIEKKINEVLTNPSYRSRILEMKEKNSRYSEERLLKVVDLLSTVGA